MKFKIGDKVQVLSWSTLRKRYKRNAIDSLNLRPDAQDSFNDDMKKLCGKVVTIEDNTQRNFHGFTYYSIIGNNYSWYDCLFKKVK